MSKLADRIKRSSRVEPAPLGFAAAAAKATAPTLLVVARLGSDLGKIKEAVDKGADVLIVEANADKLRGAKVPDGMIVGVVAGSASRQEAAVLREAGADFLMIEETSAAEALLDEKLGFVMAPPLDAEDSRLRLLSDLTLDAIWIAMPKDQLTVGRVMDLRRVAGLGRAPLLVEVDAGTQAAELQVLRESGATGVVIDVSEIGKIEGLKAQITAMPARGARKRTEDHADVLVPASAQSGGHDDDYDDDD